MHQCTKTGPPSFTTQHVARTSAGLSSMALAAPGLSVVRLSRLASFADSIANLLAEALKPTVSGFEKNSQHASDLLDGESLRLFSPSCLARGPGSGAPGSPRSYGDAIRPNFTRPVRYLLGFGGESEEEPLERGARRSAFPGEQLLGVIGVEDILMSLQRSRMMRHEARPS